MIYHGGRLSPDRDHKPQGGLWAISHERRINLPPLSVSAHTTILASASRTTLTQTFVNASSSPHKDVRYTFPLYDGVAVISFKCRIGDREITGVVKERQQAKADYEEAVDQGKYAALMEQLENSTDAYTLMVGNVQSGAKVTTTLVYVGELPHDAQVDGLRFTIPTHIVPRYGTCDVAETFVQPEGSFTVTVDVQAAPGTAIKTITSPSHPLQVAIGSLSTKDSGEPALSKASARLALESTSLEKDFVLQVVASSLSEPYAVFARHPTLADETALMATLVPRFTSQADETRREIVFVCDRSGSMGGKSIESLKKALQVFLKSLPLGCAFNVCSFGSSYALLWPESRAFTTDSFKEASAAAETFEADMGGTNMYAPIEAVLKQRQSGASLEVVVLTDGEIWQQKELFGMVTAAVDKSDGAIRVFTLGIGSGASSALVEGLAESGNGFAQFVGDGEEMDRKVVRMLKGALSPHMRNVTLEVTWKEEDDEDEFVLVEKVEDCLVLDVGEMKDTEEKEEKEEKEKPLYNPDEEENTDDAAPPSLADLPAVPIPKIIQAPSVLPSLFSFNRTSAYLLFSGAAATRTPESVTIRAQTTGGGSFAQTIPVVVLAQPDDTIHQLAARRVIQDLERGRGWLERARDAHGTLVRDKLRERGGGLVARESLRLGLKYQIGGRYTSFVAVDDDTGKDVDAEDGVDYHLVSQRPHGSRVGVMHTLRAMSMRANGARSFLQSAGSMNARRAATVTCCELNAAPLAAAPASFATAARSGLNAAAMAAAPASFESMAYCGLNAAPLAAAPAPLETSGAAAAADPSTLSRSERLRLVISLAEIDGSWTGSTALAGCLEGKVAADAPARVATAAVLAWLEGEMAEFKDVWEMLAEKTRAWLEQ